MISNLRRVAKGDPESVVLNADFINGLVDASRRAAAMDVSGRNPPLGGSPPTTFVKVHNTGADLPFGRIVRPTGIATAFESETDRFNFRREPVFTVGTPATAEDVPLIVCGHIAQGSVAAVAISGIAVCRVNATDSGHLFAKPIPGTSTHLTSDASGPARILYKAAPDSGTVGWAVVLLGAGSGGDPNLPFTVQTGPGLYNTLGGFQTEIPIPPNSSFSAFLTVQCGVNGWPTNFTHARVLVSALYPLSPGGVATYNQWQFQGSSSTLMDFNLPLCISVSNPTGTPQKVTFSAQDVTSTFGLHPPPPFLNVSVGGWAGMAYRYL